MAEIYLSDNVYQTITKRDLERKLALSEVNEHEFYDEVMDCDDFAYALHGELSVPPWSGVPFGIIWTNVHAFNLFVDDTDTVWYVEPQSDEMAPQIAAWQGSEVQLIVM